MPRAVTRCCRHVLAAVVLLLLALPTAPVRMHAADNPLTLPDLFKPGVILQDRNGDGVMDYVDARVVLGDTPSASDVAAAADIAARLGFETSAMDLPIGGDEKPWRVAIVVGQAGMKRAGVAPEQVGMKGLKPQEGIITLAGTSERPAVVVVGADEAGTRAAAEALAERLPHAWDPNGPTLTTVLADVGEFLRSQGVTPESTSLPAVYVKSGVDGFECAITVSLKSQAEITKALTALRTLTPRPAPAARRLAAKAKIPAKVAKPAKIPAPAPAPEKPKDEKRALSYPGIVALRFQLSARGAKSVSIDVPRAGAPGQAPSGRRPGTGAKEALDLGNLFASEGLLGDSDNNLIPDRIDGLLSPAGEGLDGTVNLAARLGLESAGVTLPIARTPDALGKPESEPTLVLIGTAHPVVEQLIKEKKFERPSLQPGQGLIQVIRKAFGEKPALVVTGADRAGVNRALQQMAERFPHIWQRGKDRTTIDDVEEAVRRFLSARSPAGQAATAIYKLDRIAADLAGKDLESARITVSLDKPADGLADFLRGEASAKIKAAHLELTIDNRDVEKARTVINEGFDIPSEVEEFWQVLRAKVLPAVKKKQPVLIQARLSEPPEIRAQIENDARAELIKAGAAESGTSVTVLCAYKQGYSWLYDVVRPQLAGKPIGQITIRFARIGPPPEWKQQALYIPTRWLLEIFPIDEVLARELKIDLAKIKFEETPVGSPAYEVLVTAPDGSQLLRQTFEPKVVLRSFFDQFPDYEKVRVTTGWLSATVAGTTVVDQRIETDPERFWDHFQGKTLPAIYTYVMANSKGKPRPEDAPFFGELRIEVALSEPDYPVGVEKEQIASMESVQEEIYFNTLQFFDVLGRYARGPVLAYPGRILPTVHPKADGKPGHAKITFTGFATDRPAVVVDYKERAGASGDMRLDIPKVALERPVALSVLVADGRNGLERLDLRVKVDTQKDERAALIKRTRAERVDEQIISAEQVRALVANLARLRAAGLYRDTLAYHDLRTLGVIASWEFDPNPAAEVVASLEPNGTPLPFPDIKKFLPAGYRYDGKPLVQWDTPISPAEGNEILAKMSTFSEVTPYKVGESYLGQDVWAIDVMPPIEASHWSQAKATTLKPTIIYSARQHANEVSSTSHTLKLAELLLTDPAFKKKLDKANVVFHPFTNTDGAQLAYDLQKMTPDYMLHPGYLGPLGVDVTAAEFQDDPIYPDTNIRPKLWRTWLPDIFLNPHGYPSHEWVQMFSEYAAWVRNRVTEGRDWWGMRGWFTPGFSFLDDPKYPRNKEAAFKLRSLIAAAINAAPEVRALNQRAYDRYRRYGVEWNTEDFKLDLVDGVLIYTAIKGARSNPRSSDLMVRQPNVTIWTGSTEAPDETARGDWMKLVATAGLQWDKAILDYLVSGEHVVDRKAEAFVGGVSMNINRDRPPKPKKEKETSSDHAVPRYWTGVTTRTAVSTSSATASSVRPRRNRSRASSSWRRP